MVLLLLLLLLLLLVVEAPRRRGVARRPLADAREVREGARERRNAVAWFGLGVSNGFEGVRERPERRSEVRRRR